MKSRTWMVVSLVITCLVAALALAQVYAVTREKIETQRVEATRRSLAEVLPGAGDFEPAVPDSVWLGTDAAGTRVGAVIRVARQGYGGPVPVFVGVDTAGRITGLRVASAAEGLRETPGLGLKALEPRFQDQFRGRTAADLRLEKDGGTLDAITAATITSRAVTEGVRAGMEKYAGYLKP